MYHYVIIIIFFLYVSFSFTSVYCASILEKSNIFKGDKVHIVNLKNGTGNLSELERHLSSRISFAGALELMCFDYTNSQSSASILARFCRTSISLNFIH